MLQIHFFFIPVNVISIFFSALYLNRFCFRSEPPPLQTHNNTNIILRLPDGKRIKDIKWLSVWCRRFTVSNSDKCISIFYTHVMVRLPTYLHSSRKSREFCSVSTKTINSIVVMVNTSHVPENVSYLKIYEPGMENDRVGVRGIRLYFR